MIQLLDAMKMEYRELSTLAHELADQTEDAKARAAILDFLQRVT